MKLAAKIHAYKGHLIMELLTLKQTKHVYPTQGSNMGTIICGTKQRLGVSREALVLMHKAARSYVGVVDCIGDLGWWKAGKQHCFSWFGAMFRIVNVASCEAARDFQVYEDECVIIPNEVTEEMKQAIWDNKHWWKEPLRLEGEYLPAKKTA